MTDFTEDKTKEDEKVDFNGDCGCHETKQETNQAGEGCNQDDKKENSTNKTKEQFTAEFKEFIKEQIKEEFHETKSKVKEKASQLKGKVEENVTKEKLDGMWQSSKEFLSKPVEIAQINDKKIQVPVGIAAIAATGIMYPLHKSKVLTGASALAVGAWIVKKRGGLDKAKKVIKKVEDEFNFDFADMSDIYAEVKLENPNQEEKTTESACCCNSASATDCQNEESAKPKVDLAFTTKQNLDKDSDCC